MTDCKEIITFYSLAFYWDNKTATQQIKSTYKPLLPTIKYPFVFCIIKLYIKLYI